MGFLHPELLLLALPAMFIWWRARTRPSVRLLRLIVLALLVLALSGRALSRELPGSVEEAANLLLSHEPVTAEARVDEAHEILGEERSARLTRMGSACFDLAWTGVTPSSPRRLLDSGRRLAREIRAWNARSEAEDRALALLQSDVLAQASDDRGSELYARLKSREDEKRVSRLLREAAAALSTGDLGTARRRVDRIAALRPDKRDLSELRLALSEAAERPAPQTPDPLARIESWEAPLAAALLTDRYDAVLAFGQARDDVELAQAVAAFLSGDGAAAIARLEQIENREGAPARLAATWLASESFNPGAALESSARRFRVKRALGWLGGDELEDHGLSFSREGYKAWQAALSPLNFALALPARLISGRRPEARDLHAAATGYLDRVPFGPRATAAKAWLEDSNGHGSRNQRAFDDGRFVLPRATTRYRKHDPVRLVVTSAGLGVVSRDRFTRLGIRMETDTALLLTTVNGEVPNTAITISRDTALRLAAGLAHGLEQGALTAVDSDVTVLLEGLRRLDVDLRRGAHLELEPWQPRTEQARTELSRALLEGGSPAQLQQLRIARSRKSVRVERELFARATSCPEATLCIDRARSYEGRLFARVDHDGETRLGFGGKLAQASLTLEIGRSGPRAAVVLPLGHWLGIGRWLPAELYLNVGTDGVAARPRLGPLRARSSSFAGR